MANFEESLEHVLKNEGMAFTDDPIDRGGATHMGITLRTYSEFLGRQGTVDELKAMTRLEAATVYHKLYWAKMKLDLVMDNNIATTIFDIGVNMGVGYAVKFAQESAGVRVDGVMGPLTASAINTAHRTRFMLKFVKLVQMRYVGIVISNPSQIKYLKGWLNRTYTIMDLIA